MNLAGVFQSIGNAGSDAAGAQLAAQRERVKQILDQLGIDSAKLGIEKDKAALERAPIEQQEAKQRLALLQKQIDEFGSPKPYGTVQTPTGGTLGITYAPGKGWDAKEIVAGRPMGVWSAQLDAAVRALPKEKQAFAAPLIDAYLEEGDPKAAIGAVKEIALRPEHELTPEQQAIEAAVRENKGPLSSKQITRLHEQFKEKPQGAGGDDSTIAALADAWADQGVKPPAKYQAQVEKYMATHGMKVQTKLNPQERRLSELSKQIQPKIDSLKKLIEDNKLQDEDSWVFGNHSALSQYLSFRKYKAGVKPEQVSADLIKDAAALQVMGAAPWMQLGRGKYLYETIKQHLPEPTDTPSLLYDKVQFLQGIIDDATAALPEQPEDTAGPKGGSVPKKESGSSGVIRVTPEDMK